MRAARPTLVDRAGPAVVLSPSRRTFAAAGICSSQDAAAMAMRKDQSTTVGLATLLWYLRRGCQVRFT